MIRAFVAINLPEALRPLLLEAQERGRSCLPAADVRWTRPDQIHVTLRFLGNVPTPELPKLETALKEACRGRAAWAMRIGAWGCFPDIYRPRVLWLGLEDNSGALLSLQAVIATATRAWGESDDRPFHAHVSLARCKDPRPRFRHALAPLLGQHPLSESVEWRVRQVDLMESQLTAGGAKYSILASAPLPEEATGLSVPP
jgi:2'-5' RNA ligase